MRVSLLYGQIKVYGILFTTKDKGQTALTIPLESHIKRFEPP